MQLGTTFDIDYATHLGLNWKDTLEQIVNLKLSPIRIGIKWSRVKVQKKKYNWLDYDEILELLDSKNIPILLSVGMKSPRWPEFFIPDWIETNTTNSIIDINESNIKDSLFEFIKITIERYKHLRNIKWLQVENEPFLESGPNKLRISQDLLKEEVSFVRSISNRQILLTAQGLPTTGLLAEYLKGRYKYKNKLINIADIIGFHVYPKFEHESLLNKPKTFSASKTAWKYLQKLFNKTQSVNKECWCTELQAEPWQVELVSHKDTYVNKTCNPKMVKNYIKKLENIGFKTILVWGTEFHIKCEHEGNDKWIKRIYS
ncbi:hypothetical protein ACFLY9_02830 [Patescibacteria group bacterium]